MNVIGASYVYRKVLGNVRGPVALIIQGAAVILIGFIIVLVSAGGNTDPVLKLNGQVDSVYEHTTDGIYDATWITLTDGELFTFDKSSLSPNWDYKAYKGETVDIFYANETPKQVLAIQLYNQFGDISSKYTTPAYDKNPTTFQKPGGGPNIGVFIVVLGAILVAIGGYLTIMRRRTGYD